MKIDEVLSELESLANTIGHAESERAGKALTAIEDLEGYDLERFMNKVSNKDFKSCSEALDYIEAYGLI